MRTAAAVTAVFENETVFFAAAAAIAVVAVVAVAAASEIEGHSRDSVQLVMEIEDYVRH